MDILNTPSLSKPKKDYFRTPGQIISLISSLGFVSVLILFFFFSFVCKIIFFVQNESRELSLFKHRIHQPGKANDTAVHLSCPAQCPVAG